MRTGRVLTRRRSTFDGVLPRSEGFWVDLGRPDSIAN